MTAVLLGIAIGTVMGLTGAGGGILAVPALVFTLGWPMTQAAPVALVAVGGAAALGAIEGLASRLVRYRAAGFMAALGILLTPFGVRMAHVAPERVLLFAFAAAMAVVCVRMWRQARDAAALPQDVPCRIDPATGRLHWTARVAATLGAIGASAGFLTGLLGVGGGFLIVPALRRFTDITMQGIVATSLAVTALVAIGAVVAATLQGHPPHLAVAAPFAVGTAIGMVVGRVGGRRLPPAHLQRAFAIVTAFVAIAVLVRAVQAA